MHRIDVRRRRETLAPSQSRIADVITVKSHELICSSVSNNSCIFLAASRGNRLTRRTCIRKNIHLSIVSQALRHVGTHALTHARAWARGRYLRSDFDK